MDCKLCSEFSDDPEQLINTFSEEGIQLNVQQIIKKHFGIELEPSGIDSNTNNYVCRSCCKIVCDFHQLYLKVEQTQKTLLQDVLDHTVSDDPLVELRNEFKIEFGEIKLEPHHECWSVRPELEHATKRRSKRIVAQRVNISAIQPRLGYKSLIDCDVNIKREEALLETIDIDALKEVNSHDNESSGEVAADEITQASDNLMNENEFNVKSGNKNIKQVKRRGRKGKLVSSIPLIKQPSSKNQVSKGYDEFLAENFKLSCCLCQDSLPDFTALKTHFRTQHNTSGYVLCCGKKFNKRALVDHVRTHIDPDFLKCSICKKVAASRRCLKLHMRTHEQRPERTFQCEICSKSYCRKWVFLQHIQTHVPEDEKKIKCPQCEKVFVTTYMMNQHLKLVHLNLYSKVCEICGKSIRGREAFRRHQLEHNGVPKPLLQCELCGVKLSNKYGLGRHMKTMHTEQNLRPQICTICSKVSPSISAHQRHMKYVHNMERKHACRICEKAFKRPQDLKEHMTTHTGEVLYTCTHCPKTFNSSANMYSHRKKVHRKEWEEKRKERYMKHSSALGQNRQERKNECRAVDEPYSTFNSDGAKNKPDRCLEELKINKAVDIL